jgi:hypothetical protein
MISHKTFPKNIKIIGFLAEKYFFGCDLGHGFRAGTTLSRGHARSVSVDRSACEIKFRIAAVLTNHRCPIRTNFKRPDRHNSRIAKVVVDMIRAVAGMSYRRGDTDAGSGVMDTTLETDLFRGIAKHSNFLKLSVLLRIARTGRADKANQADILVAEPLRIIDYSGSRIRLVLPAVNRKT